MAPANRIRASLASRLARRFATPADRFRVALVLGFLISAVGFITVVVDGRDGIADTMWGLGDLFGAQRAQQAETYAPQSAAPARGRDTARSSPRPAPAGRSCAPPARC